MFDPDSGGTVELCIYKDPITGGVFGIDSSYILLLGDDDPVLNPINGLMVSTRGD